jgi:hypothetical protein
MAELAPIPSAIDMMANEVNPGRFTNWRNPKRKSASSVSTQM